MTLDDIKDKCIEEGDCWIWQGYVSEQGYPYSNKRGLVSQQIRRVVVHLSGRDIKGHNIEATCDNKKCCNPAHLKLSSHSKIAKKAAPSYINHPVRIEKLRQSKMHLAKLTMEKAREIRASDEPGPVLAARYGVDKSLISSVKRNRAWREVSASSNPWAGLM
ncbi:MAG: hypothetical protein KGL39_23745 [Patescibacteria group bacterium]|nr:hypothetical protein [Patescibacteria group bacterium]